MRYYMGRHACIIVCHGGNKLLIMHLQSGHVGNKKQGYKDVRCFDMDICPTRLIRFKKEVPE
jgi:hypothetical protein